MQAEVEIEKQAQDAFGSLGLTVAETIHQGHLRHLLLPSLVAT